MIILPENHSFVLENKGTEASSHHFFMPKNSLQDAHKTTKVPTKGKNSFSKNKDLISRQLAALNNSSIDDRSKDNTLVGYQTTQ
mmetsp:Transcript_18715/g.17829  ORF Transcript_18715/g.17829 Transcript_18715/m.17829 type:complete len:84 (+) Transcript_18715:3-254(+)